LALLATHQPILHDHVLADETALFGDIEEWIMVFCVKDYDGYQLEFPSVCGGYPGWIGEAGLDEGRTEQRSIVHLLQNIQWNGME
jgi:hypothetical protein